VKQYFSSRLNYFRQRTGFQWGGGEIVLIGILVFGILSMGSGMFGKWMRSSRGGGLLMVDLHSLSSADYGVDELPLSVPAIGLEILEDLLGVNPAPETGRPDGIAQITPSNPTSTPTIAVPGAVVPTGAPEEEKPAQITPTDPNKPTATPTARNSATPTPNSPANTLPPQAPTATRTPTATSGSSPTQVIPTSTPLPQPTQPAPTQPPTSTSPPSPTSQPAASPTPRPTRSSTLAVSPTAGYTPVVSPGPPVLP
jgi:hypothetical protein